MGRPLCVLRSSRSKNAVDARLVGRRLLADRRRVGGVREVPVLDVLAARAVVGAPNSYSSAVPAETIRIG